MQPYHMVHILEAKMEIELTGNRMLVRGFEPTEWPGPHKQEDRIIFVPGKQPDDIGAYDFGEVVQAGPEASEASQPGQKIVYSLQANRPLLNNLIVMHEAEVIARYSE